MRKLISIFLFLLLISCDTEDAPDCFKATGDIVTEEVQLPFFENLNVFGHLDVIIKQGVEQQVVVEAGENFIDDVELTVVDEELQITEKNTCNLFREYGTTKIYITVPNLRRIQNSSSGTIGSDGVLAFPNISLISNNQERNSDVYTDGSFILDVASENLSITNDNLSKYFLSGTTDRFRIGFYGGDGRVEAANLIAQEVEIFHRGSNDLIVNPQQSISGEIRSTGDVIAVNQPPIVEVGSFYTGELIFE